MNIEKNNTTNYITPDVEVTDQIPSYLDRACSFAQYKTRHNLDDKMYVFDLDKIAADIDEKMLIIGNTEDMIGDMIYQLQNIQGDIYPMKRKMRGLLMLCYLWKSGSAKCEQ